MGRNGAERLVEFFPKVSLADVLECVIEIVDHAAYILDAHGNLVTFNHRAEELTGFKREDFTGKSFIELIQADGSPKTSATLLNLARGKSTRLEMRLRTTAERTVFVEVASTPFVIDGKTVGALWIAREINEQKKAKELERPEEMFKTLMEEVPIGVLNTDLEGKITYVNKRFEKATGYLREEVINKNVFKLGIMSDETLKLFTERLKKILTGEPSFISEGWFKRKDGGWMWTEIEGRLIKEFGVPVEFRLFAKDVTERKRTEEERRRFDEKLSALNTYGQNLNTAKSTEEIYSLTLDAMEKVLGFEYADLMMIDRDMLCIVDHRGYQESPTLELPVDGSKRGITVKVVKTGNSILITDLRNNEDFVQVEGLYGVLSELAVPIKVGERVLGVLNVESKELDAFDEKDQKLLEVLASHAAIAMSNLKHAKYLETYSQEVRESKEKFERFFTDNPEASVYLDSSFHILEINPRFCELFGYSSDEVIGKHINDVLVPKDKKTEGETLDKEALKGYVNYDTVRKGKNGSLIPVSVSAAPIMIEDKIIGIVGLYKDNAERKRYEERLSTLNVFSRNLNTAKSMEEIYKLTLDASEKVLGFEFADILIIEGKMLRLVTHRGPSANLSLKLSLDEDKGITVRAARTGEPVLVPDISKESAYVEGGNEMRSELAVPIGVGQRVFGVLNIESTKLNGFNERDQELLEILASHAGTAISNLEYSQNLEKLVQERTQKLTEAQKQLVQAERLAAIGEVAAMVGHDLRNPLTGIAGATYYLKTKLRGKIDEKTRGMLDIIEKDIEHSNQIITDLLDYSREIRLQLRETTPQYMIRESLGSVRIPNNIQILDSTCDIPKMKIDTSRINRVFVNIIKNAIDAMPDGGTLTIKSSQDDRNSEITFTDTGRGMSKEVMEKLWTPFFTTKAQGMGLGLSICKRITEAHAGRIFVESAVGKGTTFTVSLPVEPSSNVGEEMWVKTPESSMSTITKVHVKPLQQSS